MAIFSPQYVTWISLILSVVSAGLAVVILIVIGRMVRRIGSTSQTNVDVSAVVDEFSSRQKRLEKAIVDQRVRTEILELRLSRSSRTMMTGVPAGDFSSTSLHQQDVLKESRGVVSLPVRRQSGDAKSEGDGAMKGSLVKADGIVFDILDIVSEGRGRVTARDIQRRIGRSREHTARMMNMLYKDGLVLRNVGSRPFTYSVTELGSKELVGHRRDDVVG